MIRLRILQNMRVLGHAIENLQNAGFVNLKKNSIISIKTDKNNIPIDVFWRRRLKEAKYDYSIEVLPKLSELIPNPVKNAFKARSSSQKRVKKHDTD